MAPDEFTRAGERIQEQIVTLGELRNAGLRDQRFKLWRQNTLTLLQRLWPSDPSRAERFRRIPFSAPPTRSDREGMREFYARGCKEAANYLNALAVELGAATVPVVDLDPPADDIPIADAETANDPEPDEAWFEMPSITEAPAPRPAAPPAAEPPAAEAPAVEPPRKPMTAKPKSEFENAPISFLNRGSHPKESHSEETKPPVVPAAQAPQPRPEPAAPPPIAVSPPAAPPTPAAVAKENRPQQKKTVGMRLKDMLGFSDSSKSKQAEAPKPSAPVAPPVNVTPPAREVDVTPAPSPPPPSVSALPPVRPRPEPARDLAAEFILESPVLQSRARPLRRTGLSSYGKPPEPETQQPADPVAAAPAPPVVPPFAPVEASVAPPAPVAPRPAPFAPPPAPTVLPMPMTPPAPRAADAPVPPSIPVLASEARTEMKADEPPVSEAAQDVYDLAVHVDDLGVSPQQRAIVRAALIDLGRQMDVPPVHWEALRETVSLAMDHPELARRLLPIVLPFFDQAA